MAGCIKIGLARSMATPSAPSAVSTPVGGFGAAFTPGFARQDHLRGAQLCCPRTGTARLARSRFFFKPGSSLIGPGDAIVLPPQSQQVQHEAERLW